MESFLKEAAPYIMQFNAFIEKYHLKEIVVADHICLKCQDTHVYDGLRNLFRWNSRFRYESTIAERFITIVGLRDGFETDAGIIKTLELSDKKPGKDEETKFHHIEIVLVEDETNPNLIGYDDLVKLLVSSGERVELDERAHHSTHDVILPNGFIIRLSDVSLLEKVKDTEMV